MADQYREWAEILRTLRSDVDHLFGALRRGGGAGGGGGGTPGPPGPPGAAAGFGTPSASASGLAAGTPPTASVAASGPDTAKLFNFTFGIPAGQPGPPGPSGGVPDHQMHLYNNRNEALNPGGWIGFPFDTTIRDTDGFWDGPNRRFQARFAGTYSFDLQVSTASGAAEFGVGLGTAAAPNAPTYQGLWFTARGARMTRLLRLNLNDYLYPVFYNGWTAQVSSAAGLVTYFSALLLVPS